MAFGVCHESEHELQSSFSGAQVLAISVNYLWDSTGVRWFWDRVGNEWMSECRQWYQQRPTPLLILGAWGQTPNHWVSNVKTFYLNFFTNSALILYCQRTEYWNILLIQRRMWDKNSVYTQYSNTIFSNTNSVERRERHTWGLVWASGLSYGKKSDPLLRSMPRLRWMSSDSKSLSFQSVSLLYAYRRCLIKTLI